MTDTERQQTLRVWGICFAYEKGFGYGLDGREQQHARPIRSRGYGILRKRMQRGGIYEDRR